MPIIYITTIIPTVDLSECPETPRPRSRRSIGHPSFTMASHILESRRRARIRGWTMKDRQCPYGNLN